MSKRELARATLSVDAIHSKSLLDTLVSRIVALENEKAEIASAIRDIYVEAKGKGYSVPALKIVVKRLLESAEQRDKREAAEQEAELIQSRLGQLVGTPLAAAALAAVNGAEAH